MYLKALSIKPPLHPPLEVSQELSYYSEKLVRDPPLMAFKDSTGPTAEKAQQDPQDPWSLTPVTFP